LWSSHTDEPYIGITVGWLDPKDWTLKEGLLAYEKIKRRHTVAATTDNDANVVKAIQLIAYNQSYFVFHGSPKQTENLKNTQYEDEEYNTNLLDKLNKITNQDQLNRSSDDEDMVSNQQLQFKNHYAIKLPDTTKGVLKKIKAAIYLSICQYWDFPKEITLLSALLDP
ncbi:19981_t:CDS:2, partial [Cetraspora pellucida]